MKRVLFTPGPTEVPSEVLEAMARPLIHHRTDEYRQYFLETTRLMQEHLGTTDAMVILMRRRLIDAAKALRDQGAVPVGVDDPSLCRVRPASVLLPEGESWIAATEKARQSDAGVPIAWVPFV